MTAITKVDIFEFNVPLSRPLRIAIGIIEAANNVAVKITTDDGLVGWGESSPFGPVTGDSQASNIAAAKLFGKVLLGKDPCAIEARMAEIKTLTRGEPSVRSAFDMALHDIAAKAAGMPLYRYLGGEHREIRTDLTIGIEPGVEKTIAQATAILEQGFNAIKLKTGRANLADVEHVAALRALAGPDIAIRIDANQGWDFADAVRNLDAMTPYNIEYVEQPLNYWDVDGFARLRKKTHTPICADETVFDLHDAMRVMKAEAADYINIKLGKAGGIAMGAMVEAVARSGRSKCMIGCFAESRLGLTAAAHFAMARPNICFVDLDSAFAHKKDPVIGGIAFDEDQGGLVRLSDQPGLGASLDETFFHGALAIVVE